MIGIYKITSPTGKVYIGQSWNIKDRWNQHKNHFNNTAIAKSIKKYGWGAHIFSVVHELPFDTNQHTLDEYEAIYMNAYRDCGIRLLNIRAAGNNGRHSDETKALISKNAKRTFSDEHRKKNSESKKGNKCYLFGADPNKHPQAKRVICMATGKTFGTIEEAAKYFGIKRSTLSMMLIGKNKNKTTLTYDTK